MSDHKQNHELPNRELNDELLSAYLDGELSDAERAAVEARLASDPEAQHLLHQLRSVSQEVQALPLRLAGRDLHDQILQRIEKEKPAEKVSLLPGDAMPRITVFQTRRSWIWASLVIAAGLMIMVLQPGKETDQNLPAVARNDGNRQAKELDELSAQRSISAAPKSPVDPAHLARMDSTSSDSGVEVSESPMSITAPAAAETNAAGKLAMADRYSGGPELPATAPAASAPTDLNGQLRDAETESAFRGGGIAGAGPPAAPMLGTRVGEPAIVANGPEGRASASRSASLGVNSEAKVAMGGRGPAGPRPGAAAGMAGPGGIRAGDGGFGDAVGSPVPASGEQTSIVHVVHVVAKRNAIQSKAFDQLLARSGIELAPESASTRANGEAERAMKRAEVDRVASKLEKPSSESSESEADGDVDVVLVEAPQATIISFMAGLNKDSENYVGVEVDDSPENPQAPKGASKTEGLAKKTNTELGQFSRGIVTGQQKDAFRNRYYAYTEASSEKSKLGFDAKQEVADEGEPKPAPSAARSAGSEVAQDKLKQLATLGRARRVESWEMKGDQSGPGGPSGGAMPSQSFDGSKLRRAESVDRSAQSSDGGENANWQVLFVLSPDREEPASAPAEQATPVLKATK